MQPSIQPEHHLAEQVSRGIETFTCLYYYSGSFQLGEDSIGDLRGMWRLPDYGGICLLLKQHIFRDDQVQLTTELAHITGSRCGYLESDDLATLRNGSESLYFR